MEQQDNATVTLTVDTLRQVVRNVLNTPSIVPEPVSGELVMTIPTHRPPIDPTDVGDDLFAQLEECNSASLDTTAREGIEMECTLQAVIDSVKDAQRKGMVLAQGERRIKESAAPSSARLLEAKALQKCRSIMEMPPAKQFQIISKAAADYVKRTKQSLSSYTTVETLPKDVQMNLNEWVIPEYREEMIRTGQLSSNEVELLRNGGAKVTQALLASDDFKGYREHFWQDVRTSPQAWIFFNGFKAFLKPYWEGRRE